MIDFSALPRRNKTYAGANGSKIAVMYEDELYTSIMGMERNDPIF